MLTNILPNNIKLPDIEEIKIKFEPDVYGASYLIADQLNLERPIASYIFWKHGWKWIPINDKKYFSQHGLKYQYHIVHNLEQYKYMKAMGFSNLKIGGAPIIYSTISNNVPRAEKSLLVMPRHSLSYLSMKSNEEKYITDILKLKKYFNEIYFCIDPHSYAKGLWVDNLEKNGIKYILGAKSNDKNALNRMALIFKSFSACTGNAIGSHCVYSNYFGCPFFFYGEYEPIDVNIHASDPYYKNRKHLLERVISFEKIEKLNELFPHFFKNPDNLKADVQWARGELGHQYKKEGNELIKMMMWSKRGILLNRIQYAFSRPIKLINLVKLKALGYE